MDLRKAGRAAVLILLLLVSALPAGARVEGTSRGVERGEWARIWAAVVEWVAKLGSDMDPDGAAAPGSGSGSGEGQGGDASELGPGMDPNGRT